MVSMLALSMVDFGFRPRLGQIKDYELVLLLLHEAPAVRRKSEDWLARNLE